MEKIPAIHPLITTNADGNLVTTSVNVAESFGKLHYHVLRAIRNKAISINVSRHLFIPRTYVCPRGRTYEMYEITDIGCLVLVMGFTGANAMPIKMAYAMEFLRAREKQKAIAKEKNFAIPSLSAALEDLYVLQEENKLLRRQLEEQESQILSFSVAIKFICKCQHFMRRFLRLEAPHVH